MTCLALAVTEWMSSPAIVVALSTSLDAALRLVEIISWSDLRAAQPSAPAERAT